MWLLRSDISHYFTISVLPDVFNRKVLLIIFSINIPSYSGETTLLSYNHDDEDFRKSKFSNKEKGIKFRGSQ